MLSTQLEVLHGIQESIAKGFSVTLVSVAQTWGTSPRPVGALLAINSDGQIYGSVSGGCIEEDLIEQLTQNPPSKPSIVLYGETEEERHRFGLPCGGTMKLVIEPIHEGSKIDDLVNAIESRQVVQRQLNLGQNSVAHHECDNAARPKLTETSWSNVFGPRHQLIVIGAGQTSEYLASMALALEFKIHICDPRPEYHLHWPVAGCELHTMYPDDAIRAIGIDQRTAVVALTHDPKLDDLALLEALGSSAFYVGALGSLRTSANRKQRLQEHFGFDDHTLDKLHGPVGLPIGSKTPPEIALSVLAEVTAEKNKGLR